MIWAADRTGHVTYVCAEWTILTGQPLAETLGLGWLQVLHPEEQEAMREAFLQAFEHQCAFTLRYRLRRHTGEYLWVTGAAAPSFDPRTAAFIGCLGVVSRLESVQDQVASAALQHYCAVQSVGEFAPISKLDLLADHLLMARSTAVDAASWLLPRIDDALFDVGRAIARQQAEHDASLNLH